MDIAIIKDGAPATIGYYTELFPNVSFPAGGPEQQWMSENSVLPVVRWKDHDRLSEKLVDCAPYIEDGNVFTVVVSPMDEQEVASTTARIAAEVRGKRARLLYDSDWTQLADAPVNQAAWATYRQALRDITQQPGFPTDVTWPELIEE